MKTQFSKLLYNPYTVMWLVVIMYLGKAWLKISIGHGINSPMIEGDGYHNMADILEALAVILVIWIARRPANGNYPFGKKNVEFFTSLVIGLALLVMAVRFSIKSFIGLLAINPQYDQIARRFIDLPEHEPLIMNQETLPWVLGITAGSVVLSILVSRYQIMAGKETGHNSMVADGQETASDGRVEGITLFGVIGEYWFQAPWLEYPLGLLVALAIAHTGWELLRDSARVLLQHSIGLDHEAEIHKLCLAVAGVERAEALKTFQIGTTAVISVTIITEHRTAIISQIKYAIEYHVRRYILEEAEFKDLEFNIRFEKPEPARHRIAYAVKGENRHYVVASDLASSTHIAICDLENNMVVRVKIEDKPVDITEYLLRKQVKRIYFFNQTPEELNEILAAEIEIAASTSYQAVLLGLQPA